MKPFVLGHSANGIPIFAYGFGQTGPRVLVLGGVHGDEPEGVIASLGLMESLKENKTLEVQVVVIPLLNPDGVLSGSRVNGHGVDLNRNLPTKDWNPKSMKPKYPPGPKAASEPETQALLELFKQHQFSFIWSLHAWKPLLNVNGDCSPEVECIQEQTGYSIEPSIGYPTPGCLGTYTGLERKIPTVTYEIESGLSTKSILEIHVPAIMKALKLSEKRKELLV